MTSRCTPRPPGAPTSPPWRRAATSTPCRRSPTRSPRCGPTSSASSVRSRAGVGDVVAVEYAMVLSGNEFAGPSDGHLTVRSESGELLFWVAEAADPQRLDVPDEVIVEPGERWCTYADECDLVQLAVEGRPVAAAGQVERQDGRDIAVR